MLSGNEELPESLESYKANPLFTELARALPFVRDFAHKKSSSRHINLGELSAILEGEARRAYSKLSCRFVGLCDSQVACGALAKGRSASKPLCRFGVALGFDVLSLVGYVRSEDNPADDPTRSKDIRAPCMPKPLWLRAAEQGSFHDLDRETWGLTPPQVVGLPPMAGLLSPDFSCDDPGDAPQLGFEADLPSDGHPACLPPCYTAPFQSLLLRISLDQFLIHPRFRGNAARDQGYLDLYSGKRGVAKKLLVFGAPWVLCYDWEHDPAENLLDKKVQKPALGLVSLGAFRGVGAGPLCTSFSTATTPPIRTSHGPLRSSKLPWTLAMNTADFASCCCMLLVALAVPYGWRTLTIPGSGGNLAWLKRS